MIKGKYNAVHVHVSYAWNFRSPTDLKIFAKKPNRNEEAKNKEIPYLRRVISASHNSVDEGH